MAASALSISAVPKTNMLIMLRTAFMVTHSTEANTDVGGTEGDIPKVLIKELRESRVYSPLP